MLRSDVDRRGLRRGAKVRDFAASFTEQWLGTRALGREFKPDKSVSRRYDSELEGGMKYEPIFFFEDLLADNRSLLNLIDSDFTYVNSRLARHYRIDGEFREQPKRVELPEGSVRGGLAGDERRFGDFVLSTSNQPGATWQVDPGNAAGNATATAAAGRSQPGRDGFGRRAQRHFASGWNDIGAIRPVPPVTRRSIRSDSGWRILMCSVGGAREVDGVPIDATGQLPDGATFDGPQALKSLLLQRKDLFIRNLTAKMLGYALARGLTHEENCVVESIAETLEESDYQAQTLILEIVKSVPFRYKQGLDSKASVAVAFSGTKRTDTESPDASPSEKEVIHDQE